MSRIIYDGHIQVLVLLSTGEVPTVPTPPTLTPVDEGWVEETDIMIGEFAVNKVDDIVWTRTDNGILQINAGGIGAVNSVFGRTGDVTAQNGDYTAGQVGADPAGSAATVQANLTTHINNTSNPHAVTKSQVGLGSADNTSDVDKPVSTAQAAADAVVLSSAQSYADAIKAGLAWKSPSARIATTVAGTLTTSFVNGATIDGIVIATGDTILIKNQTDQKENGIYTVNASGSPTRRSDANSGTKLLNAVISVDEGTTNADTSWRQSTDAVVIGASNIVWASFGSTLPKATTAEINTGTDTVKYVAPDQLEASKYLNQSGSKISATATGTDTYAATISPAITAYTSTQRFFILFTNTNTGAATLNLNSLGAIAIKKAGSVALVAGDIPAGAILCLAYDGTNFQIVNTNKIYYLIELGFTATFAPADSQAYYFSNGLVPGSVDAHSGPLVPITGVVEKSFFSSRANGTPSNEDSTLILYANGSSVGNLSTDYKFGDGAGTNPMNQEKTGLNLSVTEGQHVSCRWNTPAWGTNPTNVTFYVTLLVRVL